MRASHGQDDGIASERAEIKIRQNKREEERIRRGEEIYVSKDELLMKLHE